MRNKIEDLRNHLFETIEALKDRDSPMELERAKVIADTAQVIINSAKVEVDLLRATGGSRGSGFFPAEEEEPKRLRLASSGSGGR
jgi:hypothetical protein